MKEVHELKSGWIITWIGTARLPADPLVAVINYRQTAKSVRDFVEQLYIAQRYGPREKLLCAKHPKDNPFRAQLYPFERIFCGSNPWLYARRVTNIRYANNKLTWSEPRPTDELRKELTEAGLLRDEIALS